jgi:hypothetical protein
VELIIRLSENARLIGKSDNGDWMQFYAVIADQEWYVGEESASHIIKNKSQALENIRQSIAVGTGFINFSGPHTSINFKLDGDEVCVIAHDKEGRLMFNEILG